METELYDDIFIQDKENNYETSDLDDLYGNIHIPEAAETAVQKLKSLTDDHEKVKSQNSQLKQQVKILMNKNEELNTKCCNYEKNFKELIETARTEINRKNDQIKNLRAELDNVLFKRAARNINARELEELMIKHKIPEEPFAKLPTQARLKPVNVISNNSPCNSVSNRQFVSKKRKGESPSNEKILKKSKTDSLGDNVLKAQDSVVSKSKQRFSDDISIISRYAGKDRVKKDKNSKVLKTNKQGDESNVQSASKQNHQHASVDREAKSKEGKQEEGGSPKWFCQQHQVSFRVRSELRDHMRDNGCNTRSRSRSSNKSETASPTPSPREEKSKRTDLVDKEVANSKTRNKSGTETFNKTSSATSKHEKKSDKNHRTNTNILQTSNKSDEEKSVKKVKIDAVEKIEAKSVDSKCKRKEDTDEDFLEITNNENFDDLDYEPDDNEVGSSVTFRSLTTNFNIPRKKNDAEKATASKKSSEEKVKVNSSDKISQDKIKDTFSNSNSRRKVESSKDVRRESSRDRHRDRRRDRNGTESRKRSTSRSRRRSGERRSRSRSRNRRNQKEEKTSRRRRSSSRDRLRKDKRRRSLSRKRHTSPGQKGTSGGKKSRRSQSLSPSRLNEKPQKKINLDKIDIEDDMSLDALEKIKEQLMGKMGLDDNLEPVRGKNDVEDGELSESDTEGEIEREVKIKDLRQKLVSKIPNQDSKDSSDEKVPDINNELKAVLHDYTTYDIEKKLIPFKKRQFDELQFEEKKLRKQIERARSKSNTPRRMSDSSDQMKSSPPLVIASPSIHQDDDHEDDFCPKRVSPLKLSLRGVVISRPSSSSCSLDTDTKDSGDDKEHEERLSSSNVHIDAEDDNAVFPTKDKEKTEASSKTNKDEKSTTPSSFKTKRNIRDDSGTKEESAPTISLPDDKSPPVLSLPEDSTSNDFTAILETFSNKSEDDTPTTPARSNRKLSVPSPNKLSKDILDVSRDLVLTDDSDLEQTPVKKKKCYKSPVPKTLSYDTIKKLPLTPKENITNKKLDITSPQGISDMLKSSLMATSSPVSSKPSSTNPPEILDENSSSSSTNKKKKRKMMSRSVTSTN